MYVLTQYSDHVLVPTQNIEALFTVTDRSVHFLYVTEIVFSRWATILCAPRTNVTLDVQTVDAIIHRRVRKPTARPVGYHWHGAWRTFGGGKRRHVSLHARHARLDFPISLRRAPCSNELLQMHNEALRRNREKPAAGTLATSAARRARASVDVYNIKAARRSKHKRTACCIFTLTRSFYTCRRVSVSLSPSHSPPFADHKDGVKYYKCTVPWTLGLKH